MTSASQLSVGHPQSLLSMHSTHNQVAGADAQQYDHDITGDVGHESALQELHDEVLREELLQV